MVLPVRPEYFRVVYSVANPLQPSQPLQHVEHLKLLCMAGLVHLGGLKTDIMWKLEKVDLK